MTKKKYTPGSIAWLIVKYFTVIFCSFMAILPIVSCVITSFKTSEEYQRTTVMTLPENWLNFANYLFLILIFVLAGSTLIGSSLAYVLNRFRFPGNSLIRNMFTFAALLPGIAMQVSVYQIMQQLGFINTLYGYIIMMMGTDVMSIYIYIQFFENLPISLDESAYLDGANYFRIYWSILLPLLKPAIMTNLILKGVGVYNEYYCANLYLQDKRNLCTVATSLYTFTGPMGNQYELICAGVIMSLLPALIIFLLFQKQIYNGVAAGAVKG